MIKRTTFALLACASLALGCQREKPDPTVNAAVLARLEREPMLATAALEARTQNGHVILSGQVTTPEQRRIAEHVTEDVSGVKSVTNDIQIQVGSGGAMPEESPSYRPPPPRPSDESGDPPTEGTERGGPNDQLTPMPEKQPSPQ